MKRLVMLAMALAGLSILLSSCGGGEGAGVLAVAFRLDGESPVMSAYVGNPAKDSFSLPAGRYYIEALDQDDVVLSLGAVDVEDGEAVQLPSSLGAAGGVADPGRAESLKTVASFLIDVQLAKYTFFGIVTAGFNLPPFDPDVEVDPTNVEVLHGEYEEILGREDAVLEALDQIEGRVNASAGVLYVRSPWAVGEDDLLEVIARVQLLLGLVKEWEREAGLIPDEGSPAGGISEKDYWIIRETQHFGGEVQQSQQALEKSPELLAKQSEWEEYAKDLVGEIEDEASAQWARERLTAAIASDLDEWARERMPDTTPEQREEYLKPFVDYFVTEALKVATGAPSIPTPAAVVTSTATPAVSTPKATPVRTATPATETPAPAAATATPAPDIGWIEGYVQDIADQWLDMGYSGLDVAVYADDLRQCLIQAVQAGANPEEAKYDLCPFPLFAPIITPAPQPVSTEVPTPQPAPTEAPTAEPTEAPTPEPEDVTAVGQFLFAPPNETVMGNTATLKFSTAGGDVTLKGRLDTRGPEAQSCDPYSHFLSLDCGGTYSPESGTFGGTCQTQSGTTYYSAEFTGPDEWECKPNQSGASGSGPWQATLEGTVVKGSYGDLQFELRVQG